MKLYAYWRSSASWRVRLGLNLKGLDYAVVPVDLLEAEHRSHTHTARNPMGQVPVLELADGTQLSQSLAILDYLERTVPEPALYPADPLQRARAVGLAEIVNAGVQPLQNLTVLNHVTSLGGDRSTWGRQVIQDGLEALQTAARPHAGTYLVGDTLSMADLCLIPQLYNARRFDCDLGRLELLTAIEARCADLDAFQRAHPDQQPDAPDARRTP